MKYGVVGVQGDVEEHREAAEQAAGKLELDVDTLDVTTAGELRECDVVALPGGESTTISRHIEEDGLAEALEEHVEGGGGFLATCAGLIVASHSADDERVVTLDVVDVDVERNAYGSQRESFEAPVEVDGFDDPYPGVFIRAPAIDSVGEAEAFAWLNGDVVGVRGGPDDNVYALSFHPELTADSRIHELVFQDAR